jgi:hypothetical protein
MSEDGRMMDRAHPLGARREWCHTGHLFRKYNLDKKRERRWADIPDGAAAAKAQRLK